MAIFQPQKPALTLSGVTSANPTNVTMVLVTQQD